jgi:hypothetical protein
MNYTVRYILATIAFFPAFNLVAQAPIIDYYNLLADYDDDVKLHTISQENGEWYSKSAHSTEKVKVNIDNTHDFLEIKDKEKGGTFSLQVSLFKSTDGNVYIGLVKNHLDIFLHGEIHILRLGNGRWNDVTSEIMPQLTYQDFVEKKAGLVPTNYQAEFAEHLEFGYQLPTNGRTVKAIMQTDALAKKCAAGDESIKEYCTDLDQLNYSSIELKWNAKKAKFSIGEKK